MVEYSHFMGQDGFVWFVGVVEDRNDPSALGRVRVRCLGYHSADLAELPTTDLPWAHVMHPVTDPCMHGMGNTPSFLVEGSYVVGFFRDPEKLQLVIMGTLPGVPESEADPSSGFNDPRGIYPKDDGETHSLGESSISRLARGRKHAEKHSVMVSKRKGKDLLGKVDIAKGPKMGATISDAILSRFQ